MSIIRSAFCSFCAPEFKEFYEDFIIAPSANGWQTSQSHQLGSVRPWHNVQANEKLNDYTAPGVDGGLGAYCGSENNVNFYTTLYREMKLPKKFRLKTRICFGVYAGGYGSQGGDWRLNLFSGSNLNTLDGNGWFINLNAPQQGGAGSLTCHVGHSGNAQNTITGLSNSSYNQYRYIIIDIFFDCSAKTYSGFIYNESSGKPSAPNASGSLNGVNFKNAYLKYTMRSKFLWGKAGGGMGWTLLKQLYLTKK